MRPIYPRQSIKKIFNFERILRSLYAGVVSNDIEDKNKKDISEIIRKFASEGVDLVDSLFSKEELESIFEFFASETGEKFLKLTEHEEVIVILARYQKTIRDYLNTQEFCE